MSRFNSSHNRALARTAFEAKNFAVTKKILVALLLTLITLTTGIYIISVLYSKYGSLTISVDKYDRNKYSLSLCETPDFDSKSTRLNAKMAVDITNISGNDIPADVDNINGEHNGKNHLAYTFYLKNIGDDTVTFEYYMFITNVTNDVDKAVRIKIYNDGEPTVYARTCSDGSGAESGTTEFLTNRSVVRNQIKDFKPGDISKFTIVIWIEGDDVDCIDDLIGGSLKTDMNISVIEASDKEKV